MASGARVSLARPFSMGLVPKAGDCYPVGMWRAILFMLIGMMLIPTGDAASKLLSNTHGYHPFFITWARFTVGSLLVLPFIPRAVSVFFATQWLGFEGCCWLSESAITFAVALEDLADVFAVFFIGPIISYILAAIFLKEPVTLPRSALLFLGFTGILLIARPGFGFSIGLACALLAGCAYGIFLTLSRLAAGQEEPKALLFSQLLIAAILCTPMALVLLAGASFSQPSAAHRLRRRLDARQYVFDPRLWASARHPHGALRLFSTRGRIVIGVGYFWDIARYAGGLPVWHC